MQFKFVPGEGDPDALQVCVMAAHIAILLGVKNVVAVFARLLGLIHGLVCLAQQLVGIHFFRLRIEGDAETGRDLEEDAGREGAAHLHRES